MDQTSLQSATSTAVPATQLPIAVVIPTYNRIDALLEALRHLEHQICKTFEVVIVDDGSTDATREQIERYRTTAPFRLRYLHQANSGAAKARNLAVRHIAAPVSLLIGDDIFAAPDFVQRHLDFHRLHPQLEAVALGYTRWNESGQTVTPFMQWIGHEGIQFAYGELLRGKAPGWQHFYTSNLSLQTEYLRRNPFHEGFRRYGMEDIELGYRLAADHGLKMYFLPDAVAEHLHPTDFGRSCRRMVEAGGGSYLFGQLWPEHRRTPPGSWLRRMLLPLLTEPRVVLPCLAATTGWLTRLWCPNPLMKPVLMLHERLGYQRAARAAHKS